MAVIATDTQRLSNLVKQLDADDMSLFVELVTVNEAALTTYKVGTVLGKITASGKYIVSKQAAVDGSQVPAGIVVGNSFGRPDDMSIPATTDTKVLVLARGKAVVSRGALFLDASFGTQVQKDFAEASLKALGIITETTK
jgi:hypothetical protein